MNERVNLELHSRRVSADDVFQTVEGKKKKLIFSLIFTYANSGDRSELLKTKVVRPLYNLGKGIGAFVGPIRVSDMVFIFFYFIVPLR